MTLKTHKFSICLVFLLIFLSLVAYLVNYFFFQFPGNNYFPDDSLLIGLILITFYAGLYIYYGKNSPKINYGKELLFLFAVMSVIALATNAIQFTPFKPVDNQLSHIDSYFRINVENLVQWTNNLPYLKKIFTLIYDSLPYQMCILPMILIAMGQFHLLREYYFLVLSTALLGFTIYYFFPTTAPASIFNGSFFTANQLATGIKFNQIHQHIPPITVEGGLIALPSFHVIWGFICVYLFKDWWLPFVSLLFVNTLLMFSCVFLGWHYFIDVLLSFVILGVSYYLLITLTDVPTATLSNN